jgi:putative cell wall-binding protein
VLARTIVTAALSVVMLAAVVGAPLPDAQAGVLHEAVGEVLEGLPEASQASGRAFAATPATERASVPVATPIPFSMVGFEVPDGAVLRLRTSADGSGWTDWTLVDVHPEEGPDPGSPEAAGRTPGKSFSHPVWVGEARHLQLRVDGASPAQVGVHLIDTKGLSLSLARRALDTVASAWRGAGQPAAAEVDRPAIVTREQWGANEGWRKSANPVASGGVQALFVHHTVNSNTYTQSEARGVVQGIYRYHTQSNGWNDMGYNLLVDRFGTIYEGRHGGVDRAVIGAHAGGFNTGTSGIALIGDFSNVAPGAPGRRGLETILAWKADVHHVDASAKTTMTSAGSTLYSSGRQVSLDTISGHRDVSATACPGVQLYNQLPAIRSRVADAVGALFVQPSASPSSIRLTDATTRVDEVTIRAGLKPAGAWALQVRDSQGLVVHSDIGTGSTMTSSWRPPAQAEVYRYQLRATDTADRRQAEGTITVLRDVIERIGTASAATAASVELSKAAFEERGSAEHAVLARSDVFPDAMAGGPLAGTGGPLLLGSSDRLDPAVRSELERVLPEHATVYVLGGDAAISDDVVEALEERWTVERLAGPERTATAAKVAEVVRARSGATTVMLARAGPDDAAPWADALAGGAYGAKEGIPVLLTPTDTLAPPTRAALKGVERTIVLGGVAAISAEVAQQTPNPRRIGADERTGTAVAIAEQLWGRTKGAKDDKVLVGDAYAQGAWVRALAASPFAAREQAPLLLTSSTTLSSTTATHLKDLGYSSTRTASGYILGGSGSVSDRVASDVSRLLQ